MASRAAPVLISQGGLAPEKSLSDQPVPLPLTAQLRVPVSMALLSAADAAPGMLIILIMGVTSLLQLNLNESCFPMDLHGSVARPESGAQIQQIRVYQRSDIRLTREGLRMSNSFFLKRIPFQLYTCSIRANFWPQSETRDTTIT